MAVKSTPALNRFNLFVCLLGLVGLILGLMPHGSREPERRARNADEKAQTVAVAPASAEQKASEAYGRLSLSFEENRGQAEAAVDFAARGPGYTLALSPAEAVFVLARRSDERSQSGKLLTSGNNDASDASPDEPPKILRMKLVGADEAAVVEAADELPGKVNYFIGPDPAQWRADIPTYERVRYTEVYPGVDVVYYGNQRQLEYDFHVAPGSNAGSVKLLFEGADKVETDAAGDLLLTLGETVVRQSKPFVYQEVAGARHEVEGGYTVGADGRVSFRVGEYDASLPLVIDPVLVYSTYLGGSGNEQARDIALDSAGNAYLCGDTNSTNFPTANAFDATFNTGNAATDRDAFVMKLNAAGTALVYSTYLGGTGTNVNLSGNDTCSGISVDSAGNAYVAGETRSTDFPTANALQGTFGGGLFEGFLTKLNPAGNALVYSTFIGGNTFDSATSVAVDSAGNAYVAGRTTSTNFATVNPIQATFMGGGSDAFILKLNAAGTALIYSTYLGGGGGGAFDAVFGLAIDSAGNAYITGQTSSTNFPTANAIQATFGGGSPDGDAFAAKINAAGSALVYSTYLGGSNNDIGFGVAVDSAGNAHVTGTTLSSNFPTANALDGTLAGTSDAFITKLNAAGSAFVYATYFGGTNGDSGNDIALDSAANVYIAGGTDSTDFPTASPIQALYGGGSVDAFVTKLNAAGTALIFSTYLGGSGFDRGNDIALDSTNSMYVAGATASTNFPTLNPVQAANGGGSLEGDAFVTKISDTPAPTPNVVQFSAANYAVQEDCTTVTITVNRIGDKSATASVDYNTSNATATERGDYITALGKLQFAAGETSKTFVVLINEDSYVEGNETLNLSLSNPSGVSLGEPPNATVNITDDASEPATNIIDDPANYVCQNYHDFLNRQPDQSGWDFWTSQITSCNSDLACIEARRVNVSASFFLSIEFQQTGYLVERSYKAAYGDATGNSTIGGAHQLPVPTVRFTEFLSDTQRITRGVVVLQPGWEQLLENNKQAFFLEFVQRSRFTTALPTTMTPAEFVDRLNQNAGNVLSASERTTAINLFSGAANTTNTTARAQAVRQVAEDQDLQTAEFNRAFVLMQYLGYLRRNPNDPQDSDYSGYDFWLIKLNQFNGNYINAEMVKAFITSIEYRQRFGPP